MFKRILIICLLFFGVSLYAAPFTQTYNHAPLHQVLHDLETHFSLSFLFRPQDIASAPAVSTSFNTSNWQEALSVALGEQLTYTLRKNIIIITPQPKKQEKPKLRQKTTEAPPPVIQVPIDTIPKDSILLQPKPIERLAPLPLTTPIILLKPYTPIGTSPIDTMRIARLIKAPYTPTATPLSTPKTRLRVKSQQNSTSSISLRHTFQTAVNLGYGSDIQTHIAFRYLLFFKPNWGLSMGLYGEYDAVHVNPQWQTQVRVGIPVAAHTQWMFSERWGVHAAVGAAIDFNMFRMAYESGEPVDYSPEAIYAKGFAEISAIHPINNKYSILIGVYTHHTLTNISPWTVGVHFSLLIGK